MDLKKSIWIQTDSDGLKWIQMGSKWIHVDFKWVEMVPGLGLTHLRPP